MVRGQHGLQLRARAAQCVVRGWRPRRERAPTQRQQTMEMVALGMPTGQPLPVTRDHAVCSHVQ